MKDKHIVFPSDYLAVEEEFLSGEGTFIDKDHNIRASNIGEVFTDKQKYRTKVFIKTNRMNVPKYGNTIIGSVERVQKYNVLVKVFYVNGKEVHPPYSAIMHITKASTEYLESFDDAYAVGDIIKGKVIDAHTIPIQLETRDRELGVVHAWCVRCGALAQKSGKNKLQCPECGLDMNKKTSITYGKEKVIFN